jgi:hypothetical protein
LVNALGREVTREEDLLDRRREIKLAHYHRARERLIGSCGAHLEAVVRTARKRRVWPVVSALLQGSTGAMSHLSRNLDHAEDLGVIVRDPHIRIANRIYLEVITRSLIAPGRRPNL